MQKKTGKLTVVRTSYKMDSTLESVNQAEEVAQRMAIQAGFDEDCAGNIAMAVREATVNAVLHGNGYATGKKIELGFEHGEEKLIVTVRDEGRGIDVQKLPDPLAPENLLKQSGRGIFLMRAFMDEVQFTVLQTGTEIRMVKHRHASEAHKEKHS